MKLPRGAEAIVDIVKLRDYCLSRSHVRGRHKARVFLAACGLAAEDAEEFKSILLAVAREHEATPGITDRFGTRYVVDFKWERNERSALIRSSWIVPSDGTEPRFITCFVL